MKVGPVAFLALVLSALLLCIASPTVSAEEANTIDELVQMYDDTECWECHTDIYDQWKTSWHANPINSSLKGIRNFLQIGVKEEWDTDITKAQLLKCLDCHAPVTKFASEALAKDIADMIITAFEKKGTPASDKAMKELAKINVGCTACHNIKATAIAPGLRGEPEHGYVYGANGEDSDGHKTIEAVELKRSAFCMQCHGVYTAPDGETINCNTLSRSYMDTYVNLGGLQTCQDCHMYKKDRGHTFPGGHDLDIVKEGVKLKAEIAGYRHLPGKVPGVKDAKAWVPSAVVNAFVYNKAGHRVPDG